MNTGRTSYLCPIVAVSAWGSLYVVSKPVLDVIPPFTLVLIRYLLALLLLLPLAVRTCCRNGIRIRRKDWNSFLFVGIAGYGIATGAQFIGTRLSSASVASLINSMNPVTITMFAALILGERITRKKLAALAAAILGAFLILGDNLSTGAAGILVSLLSVCLWSLMSVQVRKLSEAYPPLLITTAALVIAGIILLPVSLVELHFNAGIPDWNWGLAPSVLYMGWVCTALSQLLWNFGLSRLEASRCGMFYPLQPVISTLLGVLILHESISLHFLLGGACIIGGILCNIWSDEQTIN